MRPTVLLLSIALALLVGCRPPEDAGQPHETATPQPTREPTLTTILLPTVGPSSTSTLPPPSAVPTTSPAAIRLENADRLRVALALEGHRWPVWGVAVSPDGVRVATASTDRRVRLFETISGELLYTLEHHRDWVYSVAFSPDGQLLVSGGRDRTVQLWDPFTGERMAGARTGGEVYQIAFASDGSRFVSVGFYSALGEVWQADTGALLYMLEGHHTRLRSAAYDPSGAWLATGDEEGNILLRDARDGQARAELITGLETLALAFSPDGSTLAAGNSRGEIILFSTQTATEIRRWYGHSRQVWRLLFTPDGQLLISCGADGAIRLWEPASGERLASLSGQHSAGVRAIALSADGTVLASAGEDATVLVWRIASP